ncbi:Uncharacterised protein [Burkholderia pseudomallei]|uniref:hypothetical protein n=2 Tax=Burkholderia pseudomallei TaxID=28450 RepID=UPI000F1270BB|nr:hypothetical protein [Burkholderia pseudomallei]CAJ7239502.1 Uncharacterised protein [Burkholderia pseudomallei]VBC15405.1 Uncharacterised protein [Burkholderia pseudomallei]VBS98700.1 Uncharacterised protein [Burkholderia pseudomallei]
MCKMTNAFKFLMYGLSLSFVVSLAGCGSLSAVNNRAVDAANGTMVRMFVMLGEYDSKTMPHALGAGGATFNQEASQYRWVRVGAESQRLAFTALVTIALVPDQVAKLHMNDYVEVKFKPISGSNFDHLQAAVITKVLCPADGPNECRRKLLKDTGSLSNPLGETNEPVPDMSSFTFSKYYDGDGKKLPGISLPQ